MAKKGKTGVRLQMRRADVQKVVANLRAAGKRGLRAAGAGLYAVGNNIIAEASTRVPVDLGVLRGSGYVTLPVIQNNNVTVEMGYGGPAEDYAVRQHEDTSLKHPEGGEAKFLESSMNRQMSGTAQRVFVAEATRAFERGGRARHSGTPTIPNEGGAG